MLHRLFVSWHTRRRGRRDGRLYIPAEQATRKPAELVHLKQLGDARLRRVAADWARGDSRLVSEHQSLERKAADSQHEIDHHRKVDLDTAETEYANAYVRLEQSHREEEKRGADERWRIGSFVYGLGLFAVFFGEFPLNAVAFNLFGEGTVATWVMTAGLASVLVFCAHGLGVLMRQRVLPLKEEIIAWMLALLPVVVIVAIGVVRIQYLASIEGTLAQLGSVSGTAIFTVINLAIYLGAFILSFLHHDPVSFGIEKNERALKRANRMVRRRKRSLDREEHRLLWFNGQLALWNGALEGALREARHQAWRHKDFFEAFMQAYCAANCVAVERRMRREAKAAARLVRRTLRRTGQAIKQPAPFRTNSLSAALETWPEIVVPYEFAVDSPDVAAAVTDSTEIRLPADLTEVIRKRKRPARATA